MGCKVIDLTGRTYGEWTVLSQVPRESKGPIHWFCRCSCGNEQKLLGSSLRSGNSSRCSSCAVKARSIKSRIDLTGAQYGDWTVLSLAPRSPTVGVMWLCRCSCGVVKPVSGRSLRGGYTQRCDDCRKITPSRPHSLATRRGRTDGPPAVTLTVTNRPTEHSVQTCLCASCASRRRREKQGKCPAWKKT